MPRKKKSAAAADAVVEEAQTSPAAIPEPPKCIGCGRELDWRDRFYLGAATERCKRCVQRNWHARLGVVTFHPAVAITRQGEKTVEVPVRFNRTARRGHAAASEPRFDAAIAPRRHRHTRAERRAAARTKAGAPAVAVA